MAIGTTAAIIGGAALSAGASIYSGSKAAKASKQAAEQSAAVEKYIYDQTRADNAPWRDVGVNALGKLAGMYGVGTETSNVDWDAFVRANPDLIEYYNSHGGNNLFAMGDSMSLKDFAKANYEKYGGRDLKPYQIVSADTGGLSDFYKSPDYNFRLSESIKALDRSASARGRLNSGATKAAVVARAGDLASSEYNNYASRLAALAGIGQTANQANQQAGQQYASGMTQAITNAGNARASSYANTGNAINNTVGTLASAYLYNQGWGNSGGGFTPSSGPPLVMTART